MKKILLVCLGNICRSPAAEGVLRNILPKEFVIDSAGTDSWHIGQPPDKRSIQVCQKHGIDISYLRGRQLSHKDGAQFDLMLGMDQQNIIDMKTIIEPEFHPKITLFSQAGIADPYYGKMEDFERMFRDISAATETWKQKLLGTEV